MKFKLPKILSYKNLLDEWTKEPEQQVVSDSKKKIKKVVFHEDILEKKKRQFILELIKKHERSIREIEDAMITYHQNMILENPQVSPLLINRGGSITDAEYYNARVFWPERDGEQRELRVYLGKKSEFPDFEDPIVFAKAQALIANKLKERMREMRAAKKK